MGEGKMKESKEARSPEATYLVGAGGQEGQSCSNAALGSQEVGVLAHLLSQKGPHSIRVHGLGELHSLAQDHDFLY